MKLSTILLLFLICLTGYTQCSLKRKTSKVETEKLLKSFLKGFISNFVDPESIESFVATIKNFMNNQKCQMDYILKQGSESNDIIEEGKNEFKPVEYKNVGHGMRTYYFYGGFWAAVKRLVKRNNFINRLIKITHAVFDCFDGKLLSKIKDLVVKTITHSLGIDNAEALFSHAKDLKDMIGDANEDFHDKLYRIIEATKNSLLRLTNPENLFEFMGEMVGKTVFPFPKI